MNSHSPQLFFRILFVLILIPVNSGYLLGPQSYSSEHLYGVWHGEVNMQTQRGPALRQWNVTLTRDNRFIAEFALYQDNRLLTTSTHRGTFRVEKDKMITETEVILAPEGEEQMAPGEMIHHYKILEVTDESMIYRSLDNDVTYISKRGARP